MCSGKCAVIIVYNTYVDNVGTVSCSENPGGGEDGRPAVVVRVQVEGTRDGHLQVGYTVLSAVLYVCTTI